MGRKVGASQLVAGFATLLTVCFLNTLVVWLWPQLSLWALGVVLLLVATFLIYVYRASRKTESSDSEK